MAPPFVPADRRRTKRRSRGPTRPPDRPPLPRPYAPPKPRRAGPAAPGYLPPRHPVPAPVPQWMTPDQIMAQAQQLAGIQQGPAYQQVADARRYAEQVYQAQLARNNAIASALQGVVGGIGPSLKGTFNQAAGSQDAFGAGFAKGMQLLTQGSANQANTYLRDVVGAPEGQQIPASQATDAMDVLQFLGGENPAEQFRGQGAGFAQAAERFPMEVSARQQLGQVGAEQEYGQASAAFARQLAELARQNPLVVANFLDELYGMQRAEQQDYFERQRYEQETAYREQQDRVRQALGLYDAGLITQRELARSLRLRGTYPAKTKDQLTAKDLEIRSVSGSLVAIDPRTGKVRVIYRDPGEGPKPTYRTIGGDLWEILPGEKPRKLIDAPKDPSKPISKTLGGYIYEWNPQTRQWTPVAGAGPEPPSPANLQHVEVKGKTFTFDPATGIFHDPATGQPTNPNRSLATGKPPDPKTVTTGWKVLNQGRKPYWAAQSDSSSPLSSEQLRQTLKDAGYTLGDLPTLSDEDLDEIGIAQYQNSPQDLYLQLVQEVGLPARKAWQMVRRYYPTWGKGYFGPKGRAPAGTGAGVPRSQLAEAFYDPLGSWDQNRFGGPIGKHSDHVHLSITNPQAMLVAIDQAQRMGLRVSENPYVDHVDPVHVKGSFHYQNFPGKYNGKTLGKGIDVSGDPAQMAVFYQWATGTGEPTSLAGVTPDLARTKQGARQAGQQMAAKYGWLGSEWEALDQLWEHESHWNYAIPNQEGSGAYGIPQALPASKMASAGADWRTNPITQIKWGLKYIKQRYRTPSRAWAFWQATVNRNANLAPPDLRGQARTWISRGYEGY